MHPLQNCLPVTIKISTYVVPTSVRTGLKRLQKQMASRKKKRKWTVEQKINQGCKCSTNVRCKKKTTLSVRAQRAHAQRRAWHETPLRPGWLQVLTPRFGQLGIPRLPKRTRAPPYASRVISEHTDLCQTTF